LTTNQVAELCKFKPQTIRKYVSEQKIPFIKRGRKVLYKRNDIIQWLDQNKIETSENAYFNYLIKH
jgi:excisionase family DNA binding protein